VVREGRPASWRTTKKQMNDEKRFGITKMMNTEIGFQAALVA
jgi:hypothetical protein